VTVAAHGEVQIGQACLYCLEPLGPRVVPMLVPSRRSGNSQFWLHPHCMRSAFSEASAPFADADIEDMTVEWPSAPA